MTSIERIKVIAKASKKIANEYGHIVNFKNDYENLIDECITNLIDCDKPRLTVCGVYSAGKSTIVNVLCRKQVAEMGAQPKTDKVTEYKNENKDYILVDSPGVDAPIEHEKITDDFIKKSNVIMFVVSTKNIESEANYRKINEWMKYEKPLLIVLNDKSGGVDLDSKEINIMREKIEENLRNFGYDRNKKYDVIAINAKMAYQALSIDDDVKKNIFLEKSNITQLEALINSKMKEGFALFLAPIGELQRILDEMELELSTVETGNNKELFNQLDMIEQERVRMNESIKRQVKRACENGKEQLINVCMSGCSQEVIDETSLAVAKNIVTSVDNDYKQQLKKLSLAVNTNLEKYGIEMNETGVINIKGSEVNFDDVMLDCAENLGSTNTIKSTIGGAVLGNILGTAAGSVAGTVASTIATTAVATGGGMLASTLAGVPLGPIGMIGGAVLGFLLSSKSKKDKQMAQENELQRKIEEENKKRQIAMDAYYKKLQAEIGTKMDAIENEYTQKATKMITLAVSNLKETINRKIANSKEFDEKISEARGKISYLKAELEGLKNSIN